jgi:alkylated DNA repair dioxygenase AlkB
VLGPTPEVTIASVSLGAERRFMLKGRPGTPAEGHGESIRVPGGALVWMGPLVQSQWLHQVPKTSKPVGPRICLTFRTVYPDA